MLTSHQFSLRRQKMLIFLEELQSAGGSVQSFYIPAGQPEQSILIAIRKIVPQNIFADISDLAGKSPTGVVFFWNETKKYLILPPFPVAQPQKDSSFNMNHLTTLLKHDFCIALILVRAGAYAIGICQGEKLIGSKVGTGNIHSRQRQGGRSAKRFEHRRDKQIEYFLTRVCSHAREIILPQTRIVDYIIYGGSREIIQAYQKQCPLFQQFNNRKLPSLIDIHNPNQSVLEETIFRVWSSTIIEWQDI